MRKENNISVNVYEWNASPLRITKEEKPFHVDLVFLTKDSQNHFALIKNFSRFASSGKGQTERYFCKRCLNSFPRVESLEKHKEICGEFAAAKIELPGGKCFFKNWERMMHIPVVVYADFESIFEAMSGRKQNSRAYSLRILFSFGFSIFGNGSRVEKGRKMKPKPTSPRFHSGIDFPE